MERRAWVRYPCERESLCQPYTQEKDELWWPAELRDLSAGGASLRLSRRFEPGTILSLAWAAGAESPARQLLLRVRHATRDDRTWIIGCEFLGQLSEEDLAALL